MKFKTLYKQTNTGKIQQWEVQVRGTKVVTTYGQVGGKLQTAVDVLKEGKNLGRSNATTPETQAQAQAEQLHEAKLKEGYVLDKSLAASTKNTLEAIEPMLAHPIEKKEKYAVFPALAQPKLDGARCLAIIENGTVRLFSRTQKEWSTMPHIVEELGHLFAGETITLDGELYNHDYKDDFNKIMSIIKRDDIHPDHKLVQYHVYDVAGPGTYAVRTKILDLTLPDAKYCKEVQTVSVRSREELEEYQATCVENGFEGCMYRNPSGLYENKRSSSLLKVKTFQDAEFEIVDMEEGKGKLMGHVGAFFLKLSEDKRFKASPIGSLELMAEYWQNRKECIGKKATIKFQNYTPEGVPRFPKLKCIRDYE